jgi:hypothetical protein
VGGGGSGHSCGYGHDEIEEVAGEMVSLGMALQAQVTLAKLAPKNVKAAVRGDDR